MKRLVGFPIVLIVLLWCSTSHAELRGYWSFDDGAGTTLTDNSGRGNDGQLMGAVSQPQWASGHTGQAGDSSLRFLPTTGNRDNDPYVLLGDPDDLDIEGDQTISMWLMPTNLSWNGGRQNPYAKAYGGSGTITQESSGSPNYYYGDSGSTGGWEGFSATTPSVVDQWNHITIVRDLTNGERHWYVNGKENWNTTTKSAKAGTRPAYFARGYVSNYHGYIDDAVIWSNALSRLEVLALTHQIGTPLHPASFLDVAAYSYSTPPNAHSDYYKDEGKDGGSPTGDLTDGPFVRVGGHNTPDDGTVGWLGTTPVDITFDLDGVHAVNAIAIGYSVYSPNGNGAPDDVQIAFSTNGVNYSPFTTYTGFDDTAFRNDLFLDVAGVPASHVLLRFDGGTVTGSKYTLDQVAFLQIPEPGTGVLAILGLLVLVVYGHRRKTT